MIGSSFFRAEDTTTRFGASRTVLQIWRNGIGNRKFFHCGFMTFRNETPNDQIGPFQLLPGKRPSHTLDPAIGSASGVRGSHPKNGQGPRRSRQAPLHPSPVSKLGPCSGHICFSSASFEDAHADHIRHQFRSMIASCLTTMMLVQDASIEGRDPQRGGDRALRPMQETHDDGGAIESVGGVC